MIEEIESRCLNKFYEVDLVPMFCVLSGLEQLNIHFLRT